MLGTLRAYDATFVTTPLTAIENCRQLAEAYVSALPEVARDKDGAQEMMREFGRFLFRQGVRPEHIVVGAREASQHDRCRESIREPHLMVQAISWCIEGYYAERG